MALTKRDLTRLKGVHTDLVHLVLLMGDNCPMKFMVLEGKRTLEQQAIEVAEGDSQTMQSRHLTGHAVDLGPLLADGSIPWDDWPCWERFAACMKGASAMCEIPVIWGGDWETLVDGPHWELPKEEYPAQAPEPPVTVPA